jgi:hypothetical protein
MKYTAEMASDVMIYVSRLIKIFFWHSGNIKVNTSTI